MLLNKWDIPFKEKHMESTPGAREFLKMQGHDTVPQIYRNGKLLVEGGYDGLRALGKQQLNERLGNIDVSNFKL
jgi:glutaredoxin